MGVERREEHLFVGGHVIELGVEPHVAEAKAVPAARSLGHVPRPARLVGVHHPDVVTVVDQDRFVVRGPAREAVGRGRLGTIVQLVVDGEGDRGGEVHPLAALEIHGVPCPVRAVPPVEVLAPG